MAIKVDHYDETSGVCRLRDEQGRIFSAKCEPTARVRREESQKIEEVDRMQTETLNAGQRLDAKVRYYSAEHHVSYGEALRAMKQLEPGLWLAYATDESDLDRALRKGAGEFGRRVKAYSEEWNLSREQAPARVVAHDPEMRPYAEDPYRSEVIAGITEPLPRGESTWTPMPTGEVRPTALMMVAQLLGGLPKNPDMTIPLEQAAKVLQAGYLDLLVKAAGEKLDSLARAEINIQGRPGITSENYPQAFEAARRKYPALTEIYSGGRITAQGLRELLPHFQFAE